jgi:hypothetical protein
MERLMEIVDSASRGRHRNIRIITKDDFVRQFVKGRKEYADIEVAANLQHALDGLLADSIREWNSGKRRRRSSEPAF